MRRFVSLARRRQLLAGIGAALVGTAWLSGAGHHTSPPAGDRATATIPALGSSLHGLTPPPLEGDHHLVALVAFDIDGDGDLDVVGSDGSLELFVWENDGAGHLARKYPQRSNGWRADVPGPTFHDQLGTSHAVAQNHGPSARMDQRAESGAPNAYRLRVPESSDARRHMVRTRTPRAPPSSRLHT